MYLQMWGPWKIFFMHAGMRRLDKSKPSGVGVRPEDGVDHHVLWTVRWGYFGTKAQKHKYLGYGGGVVCAKEIKLLIRILNWKLNALARARVMCIMFPLPAPKLVYSRMLRIPFLCAPSIGKEVLEIRTFAEDMKERLGVRRCWEPGSCLEMIVFGCFPF